MQKNHKSTDIMKCSPRSDQTEPFQGGVRLKQPSFFGIGRLSQLGQTI